MKVLLLILVVLLAVILFALFGPAKSQPQPTAKPAPGAGTYPTATAGQQRPAAAAVPAPQPELSPRQRGELSTPALATGVTTETVDVGGGGATFEAKRRMTDKLNRISPSGKKR